MRLKLIDFEVILTYFIFVLLVGFLFRKISGKNKEEYFLAGRNIPWWLAGISIVATTFAADTPLVICAIYSSMGGIRGVIMTDFIQFILTLVGGVWLAINAWNYVGGQNGLSQSLERIYGESHQFLELFPSQAGWISTLEMGSLLFAVYLFIGGFLFSLLLLFSGGSLIYLATSGIAKLKDLYFKR